MPIYNFENENYKKKNNYKRISSYVFVTSRKVRIVKRFSARELTKIVRITKRSNYRVSNYTVCPVKVF